jgi:hypothetical protein
MIGIPNIKLMLSFQIFISGQIVKHQIYMEDIEGKDKQRELEIHKRYGTKKQYMIITRENGCSEIASLIAADLLIVKEYLLVRYTKSSIPKIMEKMIRILTLFTKIKKDLKSARSMLLVVSFPNACANPRTMMVKSFNTIIAK